MSFRRLCENKRDEAVRVNSFSVGAPAFFVLRAEKPNNFQSVSLEDLITKESLDWCLLSSQCHGAMKSRRTKLLLPLTMIHTVTPGQLAPDVLSTKWLWLRRRMSYLDTVDLTITVMK